MGDARFTAVNSRRGVAPKVLGALREFGIRHLIAVDSGIMAHRSNSVLLEIPKKEIKDNGVGFVRQFVDDLANHSDFPPGNATDFEWFTYSITYGSGLHKNDIHSNKLSQVERDSIVEFGRAPRIIEERLGSTEPLYLASHIGAPNEAGYWSEIIRKIQAPDTSHWPS